MPDDGDAPGPAQEFLSGTATHVGHVRVVDREAKDPARQEIHDSFRFSLQRKNLVSFSHILVTFILRMSQSHRAGDAMSSSTR